MIELFQPIAAAPPHADGWLPTLLDGPGGHLLAVGATVHAGPSDGFTSPLLFVDQNDYVGQKLPNFGGDFYERLHISQSLLALGNVIGSQTRVITIWNAFTRAQELADVIRENDEGLTLTGGPGILPYSFGVFEEQAYTVSVDTNGPPNIDALFTWDFEPYDLTLRVTGSRVTAWTFEPDWENPIIERMEWKTDVITAYDASEQRRALRLSPRKTFEFDSWFDEPKTRRYAEAVIWGWGARVWALPIWPDGQELGSALPAGSETINISTATRDFAAGSLALIMTGPRTYEVIEVLSVASSVLTLKRPTSLNWDGSALIYPARLARLSDAVNLPRWDGEISSTTARFDIVEPVDNTASGGPASYRGQPVIEIQPEWSGGVSIELARKLAELDNVTGVRYYDDESGMPLPLQSARWLLIGREAVDAFRRLAYYMQGKAKVAWLPSWTSDLIVVETITPGQTFIEVEWTAYTLQIQQQPNRRDIRIELVDGTVYYRRITASQEVSEDVERLAIDTPLGPQIEPEQIAFVSFMILARNDADAVELSHWTGETAESATTFRGMNSEL